MTNQEETAQHDSTKDLRSWWSKFTRGKPKEPAPLGPPAPVAGSIFGIPLTASIKYANVAISLMQEDGSSYTYGYIPIVVAKCGVFLKERATEVEGIFRLAGSARRTNQLQEIFNQPPTYGKTLDWTGYTVHDAANVLRRYLNQLPEPIVPLKLYEQFRDPLRQHQMQAVGNIEAQATDIGNFDYEATIEVYRNLITQLPQLNRQLLLYVLDMLAIFAAKSGINHMTAANLAVIFQPGMLHHPDHDRVPHEYRLSQDVVIFLIDQQDNFLLGMAGTAADERTRQEVEAGPPAGQPATPTRAAGVHRSVSTNSRSTNSSRLAGLRRNISVSSKGSRNSQHNLPGTPGTPGTPGVHRSNTVPSRRSPVVSQNRFNKPSEPQSSAPETATSPAATTSSGAVPVSSASIAAAITAATVATQGSDARTESVAPSLSQTSATGDQSKERLLGDGTSPQASVAGRRALTSFLRPQISDDGQSRQPNKLRKRRQPSGAQPSGHSSAASLSADLDAARSPLASPSQGPTMSGDEGLRHVSGSTNGGFALTETAPTPRAETHAESDLLKGKALARGGSQQTSDTATLKPKSEGVPDVDEFADSNADTTDASFGPEKEGEKRERKKRWRFSVSTKKNHEEKPHQLSGSQGSTSQLAGASDANLSKTSASISERGNRRSSVTNNEKPVLTDTNADLSGRRASRDIGSTEERSPTFEGADKSKGPISWFKQKLAERKEKEDAKERAKSPRRHDNTGRYPSSTNLDAAANGDTASRQRSTDVSEIIQELAEEEGVKKHAPTTDTSAAKPEPVSASTEAAVPTAVAAKESIFQGSSIEEYMGDSDREKLATAREVQANSTKQEGGGKQGTSESFNPDVVAKDAQSSVVQHAKSLAVDPAYSVGDTATTEPSDEAVTPKATDITATAADSRLVNNTEAHFSDAKGATGGPEAAA